MNILGMPNSPNLNITEKEHKLGRCQWVDIRFIITAARLEREEAGTQLDSRTHAFGLTGAYVGEAPSS